MTFREYISDVRTRLRLDEKDVHISDRAIKSILVEVAVKLIRQQTNLRKLWATDTIFTTIPCLEMTDVPITECIDFKSPKRISRSVLQLPKISEGYYYYLIQGVWDIETSSEFKYMPLHRYIDLLKLKTKANDRYYWIFNKYLYLSDPFIKKVRLSAFFEEDLPYEIRFPSNSCCPDYTINHCYNPLDDEFRLPGYLKDDVINLTIQMLIQTYLRIPNDKTNDDMEGMAQIPPSNTKNQE